MCKSESSVLKTLAYLKRHGVQYALALQTK